MKCGKEKLEKFLDTISLAEVKPIEDEDDDDDDSDVDEDTEEEKDQHDLKDQAMKSGAQNTPLNSQVNKLSCEKCKVLLKTASSNQHACKEEDQVTRICNTLYI